MENHLRTPSTLTESLQHQLNSYALAASAVGVGVLSLGAQAHGKIVYTPANKSISNLVPIDLNHDGMPDFGVCLKGMSGSCTLARNPMAADQPSPFFYYLAVIPPAAEKDNNRIWGTSTWREQEAAAALPLGFKLGPERMFQPGERLMATWASSSGQQHYGGPWKNADRRYLGFKFVIQGRSHYGWARLNVHANKQGFTARLTGYAYETIANRPIITGKTKGPDVITVQEGSLGHLAAGRK